MKPVIKAPLTVIAGDAAVERHYTRDPQTRERVPDPILDGLVTAARATRESAETLAELCNASHSDETMPPAARQLSLRNNALRLGETAARRLDAATARATEAINEITARIATPEPMGNPNLGSEIRARLSALPQKERDDAVSAAFSAGDATVMAAVLSAPAFLSGLTEGQLEMRRFEWQRKKFPGEVSRIERLKKAVGDIERAGKSFTNFVTDIAVTPAAQLAESMAKRADAARRAVARQAEDAE